MFESEGMPRDSEKGGRKRKDPTQNTKGDFGEDGFEFKWEGDGVADSLFDQDGMGTNERHVEQKELMMEKDISPEPKDSFVVSQENYMNITTNVAPPLKHRDYKAASAVCYEEPVVYDMKQHHSPEESDTVQLTTGNCKSIRGDSPLVVDVVCMQMANTGSNGSDLNYDISATLSDNNTLAVAYKDENDS